MKDSHRRGLIPAWDDAHNIGFIGGTPESPLVYIRPFGPFRAGEGVEGHQHWIDHLSFIEAGRVLFEWTDQQGNAGAVEVEAPNFLNVVASRSHKLTALTDGARWRCIFVNPGKYEQAAGTPIPFHTEKPRG